MVKAVEASLPAHVMKQSPGEILLVYHSAHALCTSSHAASDGGAATLDQTLMAILRDASAGPGAGVLWVPMRACSSIIERAAECC